MALVAYDNSDSSDYEDVDNQNATAVILNNKIEVPNPPLPIPVTVNKEIESQAENSPSLFSLLPQPSRKKMPAVIEEDDEFLHKKEDNNIVKPKAKITVPSLNDFKDVEHSIPLAKPKTANGKKSGLLSILPQPRNAVMSTNKSLIPQVLTQKSHSIIKKDLAKSQLPLKKAKIDSKPLIDDCSDDSDNEEMANDFFSINKPVKIPEDIEVPLDIVPNLNTVNSTANVAKSRSIESFFKKDIDIQSEQVYDERPDQSEAGSSYNGYGADNLRSNDIALDDEAILKLCGTRGKRKREDIQIVDVNQQEVLAGARELLLKSLMDDTTKRVSASKKKGHEPTSQQRRKHQITYLAHQAKANEAELQNQWANNRMSKRQTQSKYGF